MKLTTVLAAAAVSAMPIAASAATLPISSGGTTTVTTFDDTYTFVGFSANPFTHTFNVSGQGAGVAAVSMDQLLAAFFSSTTFAWDNGTSSTLNSQGKATVTTDFTSGGDTLTLSFASGTTTGASYSGSVQLSAVPVPAGLLLMGTALAGLGLMRRKS